MRERRQKGYRRFVRVGDSLQQIIAEAIERKVDNPKLGFVTITKVDAAPDLRTAKVYVSVLGGGPTASKDSVAALEQSSTILQREISRQMRMKWTPRLYFVADDMPERADRITRMILDTEPAQADPLEETASDAASANTPEAAAPENAAPKTTEEGNQT